MLSLSFLLCDVIFMSCSFDKHLLSAAPPPASPDEGVSRWTELQARLDKMTAVSQNSDIQRRGQVQ